MRRAAMALSLVAVVCLAAGITAQGKPSFAGKWTLVPDPNAAAGGGGRGGRGGGGWGMENTITQDAKTLTVEYTAGQNPAPVKVIFNLDGSESNNTMPGRQGGEPMVQSSKAVWDGDKLVITITVSFGGNSVEIKRVVSLEAGNLIVETTNPGFQGGAATTTKATYKKN